MSLPSFSGRRATSRAAQTAAPPEMPARIPSSLQSRRAISPASSCFTATISSSSFVSSTFGTNPGPQPWILCGPGFPPAMTGESAGSAATILQRRLARLHHLRAAGDRPAGAGAADEDVHLAVRVAPDLLGGGPPVDLGVRRVLELLEDEVARVLRRHLLRPLDRALHPLGARA